MHGWCAVGGLSWWNGKTIVAIQSLSNPTRFCMLLLVCVLLLIAAGCSGVPYKVPYNTLGYYSSCRQKRKTCFKFSSHGSLHPNNSFPSNVDVLTACEPNAAILLGPHTTSAARKHPSIDEYFYGRSTKLTESTKLPTLEWLFANSTISKGKAPSATRAGSS